MNEDLLEVEVQHELEAPVNAVTGQRPTMKFNGSGGISIAIWKSKSEAGRTGYSVRIDRSYKNERGEYESTPYLRESDLLRTQQLLSQVDAWIEQDKAKTRQATAQSR